MGMHPNVYIGNLPKQTDLVDADVEVSFRQDLNKSVTGSIVRSDADAPFRTLIELHEGGFIVDSSECVFRIASKTQTRPRLIDDLGGDLEDQGTGLVWLEPVRLVDVSERGIAFVIVEWDEVLLTLTDDHATNIGPSACGFDVAAVAWLLEGDNLHYIKAFRTSPELTAWKEA